VHRFLLRWYLVALILALVVRLGVLLGDKVVGTHAASGERYLVFDVSENYVTCTGFSLGRMGCALDDQRQGDPGAQVSGWAQQPGNVVRVRSISAVLRQRLPPHSKA
jgi:hypothetical protein